MRAATWGFISALALGLCGSAAFGTAARPLGTRPVHHNWSEVTAATPQGYRLGNPAAPVKIVEFGSIGCPHCAAFSREATSALTSEYIQSGKVSWEFRPYLIFAPDIGASMLLLCHGPKDVFPLIEEIYRTQPVWYGKLTSLSDDQKAQLSAVPRRQQITAIVQASGLGEVFRRHGMSAVRVQACMADDKVLHRMFANQEAANQFHLEGTPSFLINGEKQEAISWSALRPLLDAKVHEIITDH